MIRRNHWIQHFTSSCKSRLGQGRKSPHLHDTRRGGQQYNCWGYPQCHRNCLVIRCTCKRTGHIATMVLELISWAWSIDSHILRGIRRSGASVRRLGRSFARVRILSWYTGGGDTDEGKSNDATECSELHERMS